MTNVFRYAIVKNMKNLIQKGWPEELQNYSKDLVELDLNVPRGIYFLFRRGELVYIGKSNNIHRRIHQHRSRRVFDKALYVPVDDYMDVMETILIKSFKPKWNVKDNPDNIPKKTHVNKGIKRTLQVSMGPHPKPTPKYKMKDISLIISKASDDIIKRVLSTITEIERKIIIKRYGLFGCEKYTLQRIGDEYGLSRERIRQIQNKAERKIAHPTRMNAILNSLKE